MSGSVEESLAFASAFAVFAGTPRTFLTLVIETRSLPFLALPSAFKTCLRVTSSSFAASDAVERLRFLRAGFAAGLLVLEKSISSSPMSFSDLTTFAAM